MNPAVAMTMFGRTIRTGIVSLLTVVMLLLPVSLAWCCTGGSMPASTDCEASPRQDAPASCLGMAAEFGRVSVPADARQVLIRPLKSADRLPEFDGDTHLAARPSAATWPVPPQAIRFLTAAIPPPVSLHRPLYLQTARLRL
ncbi:hypothetical protein [Nevskia sp.]|uniref:hypothetical protein n=1 Tax=Nevskia sp. TaxID=1929292 RepID=UPI0025F907AF|nr:hypothetical protein [Nevskia sp.]